MEAICAIATPYGNGAISIIRCSGDDAIELVNNIFRGKNLNKAKANTISYGFIVDKEDIVDEVMVSIFRAPHSFDGENSVEINCHGGILVTSEVLNLLLRSGFRLAEPGEFSKRAFLNHKLDLTKAESIMDIVEAENKLALKSSINALNSNLNKLISKFRNDILELMAQIEVNIDYPEYDDVEEVTKDFLIPRMNTLSNTLDDVLERSKVSKIIHNGIKTAIIGRPNVGKSSLLNMLLDEDKAIVSNIAGTTRDIVEGHINLGDISLHLLDTAGIRDNSDDFIENIGITKSRKLMETTDLVLLVLDVSEELTAIDQELVELVKDKAHVFVANKTDLTNMWELPNTVYISALNKDGIIELKDAIFKATKLDTFNQYNPILNNARQIALTTDAKLFIDNALKTALDSADIALIATDLKNAFDSLGEITGEAYPDELITKLFSNFCLGK